MLKKLGHHDGVTLYLEYDSHKRLLSKKFQDVKGYIEITTYIYDLAGNLLRVTRPDQSFLEMSYDAAHRLNMLNDSAGNTVRYDLDNAGNIIHLESWGPNQDVVYRLSRSYDSLNKLQNEKKGFENVGKTYQYDQNGNLSTVVDELGRTSRKQYDNFNRLVRNDDPPQSNGSATTTNFAYNNQDSLTSVIDPRRITTSYAVDGFGNRTAIDSPDTGMSSRVFDNSGKLKTSKDARGIVTEYKWNSAGRITQSGNTIFEYGASMSPESGRLIRFRDETGQTTFSYDGFGRVQSKSQIVNVGPTSRTFRIGYIYGTHGTEAGHLVSMTYPSGARVNIKYGDNSLPASMSIVYPGTSDVVPLVNDIKYSQSGVPISWSWGNSNGTSKNDYVRTFDERGRMLSYPLGNVNSGGVIRTIQYDAAGRATEFNHSGGTNAALLNQQFSYDEFDRIIRFSSQSTTQSFSYDKVGSRTGVSFGAASYTNLISQTSNRLDSTTGPEHAKVNQYDASGNLLSDGTTSYSYSATGRIETTTAQGITTRYYYNGIGQRIAKMGPAGSSYYFFDEKGRMIGEHDGFSRKKQEIFYLGDIPIVVFSALSNTKLPRLAYVFTDQAITPRILISSDDNAIVWRWDQSDPFGLLMPLEDPNGLGRFTFNLRFPGQVFDMETNTHYNYYRDYDPQTGRYLQSDPLGLEGGVNTYIYADGNPVSMIDPSGLSTIIYDGNGHNAIVKDRNGNTIGNFPANNNTTTNSNGPWPNGTFPYSHSNPHPESGANGAYGSKGILVFNVPGRPGMGLHSGRVNSGAQNHPTYGCIRTTDEAMSFIRNLIPTDPITNMSVINNNLNAAQSGTQQ